MPNKTLTLMTSASALTGAELFYSVQGTSDVKVTSSQFYTYITTVSTLAGGGSSAAGVSGNLQYNNGGVFGAILNSSWDATNSIFNLQANTLTVASTTAIERMRIDSAGLVNIGNLGANVPIGGSNSPLQISAGPTFAYGASIMSVGATANAMPLALNKTRGANAATQSAVNNQDVLGQMTFGGSDGTNYLQTASIRAVATSSGTAGSVPTMLILGSGSTNFGWTDTLGIDTLGNVSINAFGSLTFAGLTAKLQILNNIAFGWHEFLIQIGNNAFGAGLIFGKTRASFGSGVTIVQVNDEIGSNRFYATDGVQQQEAGRMKFEVDAAPAAGSMPGRYVVMTTPSGTVTPVERMRIDNQGLAYLGNLTGGPFASGGALNIGVNTSALDAVNFLAYDAATGFGPNVNLEYTRGTVPSSNVIVQSSDGLGYINFQGANGVASYRRAATIWAAVEPTPSAAVVPAGIRFGTTPNAGVFAERMRIDSAGRLVYGGVASHLGMFGLEAHVQINMTDGVINQSWSAWQASAGGPYVGFEKSRGATIGTQALVSSGDEIGLIAWAGSDGVAFRRAGGLDVIIDDTPAAGSMPGRMALATTPTGSITPVERMRIDNTGNVTFSNPTGAVSSNTTVDGFGSHIQAVSNDSTWSFSQITTQNVGGVASLMFAKTRGTVPSSNVIVQNGDRTFEMWCYGNDGVNYRANSRLAVEVDGVPGVNSMPGRWIFATASSTVVNNAIERMRIDNAGNAWLMTATSTTGATPTGAKANLNGVAANFAHASYGGI